MGLALADFGRDPHSCDSLRGIIFKKCKNCSKFPRLATSGRHNSTMIKNAENSWQNGPLRDV